MSPIKQACAVRSACSSPASTSVSASAVDPLQDLHDFADSKIKIELAIKIPQDVTERQGRKLRDQGRLLLKYQRLEIRILKEDGRKAICKLMKADYESAKQNWAIFLQSLSQDEIALLQLARLHSKPWMRHNMTNSRNTVAPQPTALLQMQQLLLLQVYLHLLESPTSCCLMHYMAKALLTKRRSKLGIFQMSEYS